MSERVGRRRFLAGTAVAATVVAFDPVFGWVAEADPRTAAAIPVPGLDGELVTDPASLAEAADDYGHIVHKTPIAVLRPASAKDVQVMVRYADRHGLKVAMRGQGHSTFGQAQVKGGVVIDSRTLATIHEISAHGAVVDAGVQWLDLAKAAIAKGLTPPVFTDYLGLSVGGTLSVGGVGGATSHYGLQVDNALELDVVTGKGDLVTCSATRNRELFRAVLGGLGQFGIIVRATVKVIPAKTTARVYHLNYADVATLTRAQRIALADGRFDYLEGSVNAVEGGGWSYQLEGVVYYTAPHAPDDAAKVAGLPAPTSSDIAEVTYFDWLNRIYDLVEQLKQLGFPSPWINLYLPDGPTNNYVAETMASLTPADTGGGPILLYPIKTALLHRPYVEVPETEVAFLFAILRMAADPALVAPMLKSNRALYEKARALGGKLYPVSAVPMTPVDWVRHYGRDYPRFVADKALFDPRHTLTPGQGIFVA
jgi:cytokinin dehydrogenase